MLADNLIFLRNIKGLTQEQVAEVIGISRQSYSKWEQGETYPDIDKCDKLAKYYGVTIDSLVHQDNKVDDIKIAPAPIGKHLWGTVTIGSKGQIVIPKAARETFKLNEGDRLVVLGDDAEGIALVKVDVFEHICWKDNLMLLNDRKVGEVLNRLSRYYGRTILFGKEIGEIPISGKLDLRESLEEVVEIICQSLFLRQERDGENNIILLK